VREMKIAVTSTGPTLDSNIDPRFGRCPYFLIVETETMDFESIPNPNVSVPSGAGIQAAQLIANKGAKILITGNVGPNAIEALSYAGINVITGVSGKVRDAVQMFKEGKLKATSPPALSYYPPGRGKGAGRGMGRGGGGFGMGYNPYGDMGYPYYPQPPPISPPFFQPPSTDDEIEMLKRQIDILRKRLEEINRRLKELESEEGSE